MIAGLVGLGTISLISQLHRTGARQRQISAATAEARKTLETVASLVAPAGGGTSFDELLKSPASPFNGGSTSAALDTGGTWSHTTALAGGLTRVVSLKNVPPDPARVLTLTITIKYTDQGQTRDMTLQTKVVR